MASARSLFVIYKKIKHTRALNTGPENTDRGKSVKKLVIKALKDQEPRNYLMFFFFLFRIRGGKEEGGGVSHTLCRTGASAFEQPLN